MDRFQNYIILGVFSGKIMDTASNRSDLADRLPDNDRFGHSFLGDWCCQVMVF
jgi:hypothetical protein